MAKAVALDKIDPSQVRVNTSSKNSPSSRVYPFFWATEEGQTRPCVFLVRYAKGTWSSAHFHTVDQFNIVVEGKGHFGRHEQTPYHVHFSRPYTPYGPLQPSKDEDWSFLTVRTRYDAGAQRMPESREKLDKVPNRHPWQVTRHVEFAPEGSKATLQPLPDIVDDRGLIASALTLPPGGSIKTPDPSGGDGQYVIVFEGSVLHDGAEHSGLAVVSIKPDEPAFEVRAGAQGLKGVVLNFPRVGVAQAVAPAPAQSAELKTWLCVLCGFVYDEAQGLPEDGIPAGTRWKDVPDNWTCPDCSVGKADFEMIEL